jgi:hypothetical protein
MRRGVIGYRLSVVGCRWSMISRIRRSPTPRSVRTGLSANGVSRRCSELSLHKRCGLPKGKPNPTGAGPYPSRSRCSNSAGAEVRSQCGARTVAKGPGNDTLGGVAIRPGRCAKLPFVVKHWVSSPCVGRPLTAGVRLPSQTVRVLGGVAERQWLATLTGEAPRRPCTGRERLPISLRRSGRRMRR